MNDFMGGTSFRAFCLLYCPAGRGGDDGCTPAKTPPRTTLTDGVTPAKTPPRTTLTDAQNFELSRGRSDLPLKLADRAAGGDGGDAPTP